MNHLCYQFLVKKKKQTSDDNNKQEKLVLPQLVISLGSGGPAKWSIGLQVFLSVVIILEPTIGTAPAASKL